VNTPEKKRAKSAAGVVAKHRKSGEKLSADAIVNLLKEPCCGYKCNTDLPQAAFESALMERADSMPKQNFAVLKLQQCALTASSVSQDCGHPREGYFIGKVSVCKAFFVRAYGFSSKTLDRARRIVAGVEEMEEEVPNVDVGDVQESQNVDVVAGVSVRKARLNSGPFSFTGKPKADHAVAWLHHYASTAGDRFPSAEDGERQIIRLPHFTTKQVSSENRAG
jgi:hypothetical protein